MSRYQWEKARKLILERDEHQCVRCGHARDLQVHHRCPRGAGGTSRPEIAYGLANLLTLCLFCHEYIESRRTWSKQLGYLVRQGKTPAFQPVWLYGHGWSLIQDDGSVEPVRDIPEEAS